MVGSTEDLGAPESWEVADLEESVKQIMLRDGNQSTVSSVAESVGNFGFPSNSSSELPSSSGSDGKGRSYSESAINQVDQFLREALQNPRERVSVLRMEQDVEKFICDPTQQQLVFQQLPTSYLRLAAHRVAQHYYLQSMVLLDNMYDDVSASKIIIRKTSGCHKLPSLRLADIPVNLPSDDVDVVKVAIKQRPQKHLQTFQSTTSNSSNENNTRSVEERKEEYNKARARIFNSTSCSTHTSGKQENQAKILDGYRRGAVKPEEKSVFVGSDPIRRPVDFTTTGFMPDRIRAERDSAPRWRPNNRVAILRDREVDKKDPDYDRSYDKYTQRFDPGFGFNGGPYPIQPMYSPAVNYNTEFPQLGASHSHGPQISLERQSTPLPQHVNVHWNPACGYGHSDVVLPHYTPNHVGAPSTSTMYMHSSQYACQRPGIPFMFPMEHVQQPFLQPHQQPETNFGVARPR